MAAARVWLGAWHQRLMRAGEAAIVPAGAAHRIAPHGDEPLRAIVVHDARAGHPAGCRA